MWWTNAWLAKNLPGLVAFIATAIKLNEDSVKMAMLAGATAAVAWVALSSLIQLCAWAIRKTGMAAILGVVIKNAILALTSVASLWACYEYVTIENVLWAYHQSNLILMKYGVIPAPGSGAVPDI